MKRLFLVAVLMLAGIACLAYYRGWFAFSTAESDHAVDVTISVDREKIHEDEEKLKESAHRVGNKMTTESGHPLRKVVRSLSRGSTRIR